MGYTLKKLIANIKNFGLKRALSKIKYIVIIILSASDIVNTFF